MINVATLRCVTSETKTNPGEFLRRRRGREDRRAFRVAAKTRIPEERSASSLPASSDNSATTLFNMLERMNQLRAVVDRILRANLSEWSLYSHLIVDRM